MKSTKTEFSQKAKIHWFQFWSFWLVLDPLDIFSLQLTRPDRGDSCTTLIISNSTIKDFEMRISFIF